MDGNHLHLRVGVEMAEEQEGGWKVTAEAFEEEDREEEADVRI